MKITLPKVFEFTATGFLAAMREIRRALELLAEAPGVREQYLLTDEGLKDLTLTNGAVNKFKHRLGRQLTGWSLRDIRGASATGRIIRVTTSGGQDADDGEDLWLDVQGHGADLTVRIVVE